MKCPEFLYPLFFAGFPVQMELKLTIILEEFR